MISKFRELKPMLQKQLASSATSGQILKRVKFHRLAHCIVVGGIMAGAPALLTSSLLATPIGIDDEPGALTHLRRDALSEKQPQRFTQLGKTFSVGNAVAKPGEKIPLKVTLASGLNPDAAFVMFVGLPADFRISAGVKTKDAWAVSLREVSGLSLIPPNGWEGVLELDVVLVRGKDALPDRQTMIILVKPDDLTDRVAKAETASPPTAFTELDDKPPLPRLPAEMSSEDTAFLQRGDQLLDTGDVAAARLFFTRLAKKGVAMGALRMARTYDPEFLGSMRTAGLQPDLQQARVWYQKASELGSQDATKRLSTLSSAEPQR